MNRFKTYFFKLTIAMFAVGLAVSVSPVSRAEDQPSSQPATTSTTASQPATAASQPAADTQQRLQELENEVTALQSAIASLKADSAPAMKTAAYAQPASSASAYTPPTAVDDAPPKISIASLLGPVTLSGFGDVYYGYDYYHPENNLAGLRYFEAPTNGFGFNMAELILDKAADATSAESRVGYHVSAGYGQAAAIINGSDVPFGYYSGDNFYLKEAYASYLAPVGKGLTITVGKFVTNAGAEVIESNANWNYSRSLLFYYAIPYFHFGAKAAYTFNPKWAVNVSLVNGWNNTNITHDFAGQSSGLTYGGSVTYTPNAKWSVIENYYAGPVVDGFGSGSKTFNHWKQLSDSIISYTPNAKWAFQVNGDYGFGPRFESEECDDAIVAQGVEECTFGPKVNWWGAAGYLKYTMSPKTNFAVRYEYFNDTDGYAGLLGGTEGWVQEVTGTYSYNLTSALLVRGEYRYDYASTPFFYTGSRYLRDQNTASLSFVYSFSSANMK